MAVDLVYVVGGITFVVPVYEDAEGAGVKGKVEDEGVEVGGDGVEVFGGGWEGGAGEGVGMGEIEYSSKRAGCVDEGGAAAAGLFFGGVHVAGGVLALHNEEGVVDARGDLKEVEDFAGDDLARLEGVLLSLEGEGYVWSGVRHVFVLGQQFSYIGG